MHHLRIITLILTALVLSTTSSEETKNSGYRVIRKIFDQCASRDEMFKCLKIQALKIVDRALHSKSINVIDGVNLVLSENRNAKNLKNGLNLNETKLQKLSSNEINGLLSDTASRFLQTHKLEVSVPRLIEEGRRKRRRGGFGALFWALAIKGSFLAMAYNGIAVMSGTALIVGKMALMLTAILGLKKLVKSDHESTTFEIIKQPKYSESHTHSTSYEDDGHYHRSYELDGTIPQKRIYRTYIPAV